MAKYSSLTNFENIAYFLQQFSIFRFAMLNFCRYDAYGIPEYG